MADAAGATEVHVFNGLVKAQLLDESGKQIRTVELNTAEAARIQPASATVARIPARDDRIRADTFRDVRAARRAVLAYDGFNYPAGPLDEQNGGFGLGRAVVQRSNRTQSRTPARTACSRGVWNMKGWCRWRITQCRRPSKTAFGARWARASAACSTRRGWSKTRTACGSLAAMATVVYLSFLQRVDKINDVFYGFELHRGDGNGNRVLCIGNGVEGTGYGVTSNVERVWPAEFSLAWK